jgi:hypothetical protein
MEPQHNQRVVEASKTPHPVNQITPISKYLALALFILLPFVGGYVGWNFALLNQETNVHVHTSHTLTNEIDNSTSTPTSLVPDDKSFVLEEIIQKFSSGKDFKNRPCSESIYAQSDFNSLDRDSLDCEQITFEGNTITVLWASCGGCAEFYLGSTEYLKLKNFPYFDAVLYDKTEIFGEYLGLTVDEIFVYDITTDTRKNLYTAAEDESLLWCEHGCGFDDVQLNRINGELYLDIYVYDGSITDYNKAHDSQQKKTIKLDIN